MEITVGHIIDNPTIETCLDYRIVTCESDGSWSDLYNSRIDDDELPAELLIRQVIYISVGNEQLVLEVR